MKRIVKNPQVRKQEIIDAAKQLFQTRGYNNTPVDAIIQEVGIAKGTFYYYFKTKQDILSAIVQQLSQEIHQYFQAIVENKELPAIEKLKLMLRSHEKTDKNDSTIMEIIHKPENRELQEQLNIESVQLIAPLITKILQQGYQENIFKKSASLESIQLLLAGSQFILDSGLFNWSKEKRVALLKTLQSMLEQLVGAKPNSLNFIATE